MADMSAWIELITDFTIEKDKSKLDAVLQIFNTLPINFQIILIDKAINYYCRKFNILVLCDKQLNPIYYYEI